MEKNEYLDGLDDHSNVVCLILNTIDDPLNPHYKHHIRSAIREASYKVVGFKGSGSKGKAHFMSKAAKKQMESGNIDGLIGEHIIPVSIINKKVLDRYKSKKNGEKIEKSEIIEIVKEWSVHAVITREEDTRLKEAKLTKTMPEGWNDGDKFARYNHVNPKIEWITNEYSELKKLKRNK